MTLVGVISDTHGLIRPEALAALDGVSLILHAGDVGGPEVLAALAAIAPVAAVRGNNDHGAWAEQLPPTERVRIAGRTVYLLHDAHDLDLDPAAEGIAAVIAGHSHQPRNERARGVLFFNPGSAGPRRFKLPIAVGRLRFTDEKIDAEVIEIVR